MRPFSVLTLIVFLLSSQCKTLAQEIPAGGKIITSEVKLRNLAFKKDGLGAIENNKAKTNADLQLTVETFAQPDNIYNLAVRMPTRPVDVEKGDIVLISFSAKTISASLETGEARAQFLVGSEGKKNPQDRVIQAVSIGSDWKNYFFPIVMPISADKEEFQIALQFGFPPQKFLMKNIEIRLFDKKTPLASMPRTRAEYAGMDENAAWREAANARIEKIRKGDFEFHITKNKKPVKNALVNVELKKHHFLFGAAVNAENIASDPAHLQRISEAFNLIVFENDLKIKHWSKGKNNKTTLKAIELLRLNGVQVKGHALVWPGFAHLPATFKNATAEKAVELQKAHLDDILSQTAGTISRWDVVNEACTNEDLQKLTGSEDILADCFFEAKSQQPDALRFVNDYGIISNGGLNRKKQQQYFDFVKRMDATTNGLVDGIGMQSHIGTDLTSPEKTLEILDFYAPLGKKLAITEFTLDVDDAAVREQYTRDFMIAAFSHASVSEFLFWGTATEKADIFKEDGSPAAMGKAFFSLVHGDWKTKNSSNTNGKGRAKGRGFYGFYEYTIQIDGKETKGTFELLPEKSTVVEVELK